MHNLSDQENQEPTLDIPEIPSISSRLPTSFEKAEDDVVHATRDDHDEGMVVENINIV